MDIVKIKYKSKMVLPILLLVILSVTLFWSSKKEGYFIDEVYTFGLANNAYSPFLKEGLNGAPLADYMYTKFYAQDLSGTLENIKGIVNDIKENGIRGSEIFAAYKADVYAKYTPAWLDKEYLLNYAAIQEGHKFDFISVYYNQFRDVHPPFYYLIVNICSSFFPNQIPDNICIYINIFFMMLTCIMVYKLSEVYFKDIRMMCLATLFYGLSMGTLSMSLYLRMYSMLTFFIISNFWYHYQYLNNDFKLNKKIAMGIGLTTIAGFYTQYFYLIYLFFVMNIILAIMIKQKKFYNIMKYFSLLGVAGVISLIIWPFSIRHLLSSSKSSEMVDNLIHSNYIVNLLDFIQLIIKSFFVNKLIFILYIIMLIAGACYLMIKKRIFLYQIFHKKQLLLMVPCIGYLLVIAKISDIQSDRYIMCIYPFIVILMIDLAFLIISNIIYKKRIFLMIGMLSLVLLFAYLKNTPNYLYNRTPESIEFDNMLQGKRCLYIKTAGNAYTVFIPDFIRRNNQLMIVDEGKLSYLEPQSINEFDEIIVFISGAADENTVVENLNNLYDGSVEYIKEIESYGVDKDETFYTKVYELKRSCQEK